MLQPENFLTATLRAHPYGQNIARILSASIHAVEPGQAVQRFVQREGQNLIVDGQVYELDHIGRIVLLGVGKAAKAMSIPLVEILADHSPRGLIIPKQNFSMSWAGYEVQPGGHPIPNENSLKAGMKAIELVRSLGKNDLLICLISGGGSSLMTYPQPGLTLADLQALTCSMLSCGARIDEINTLRRHLDLVKGGRLAQAAAPAQVISLILSDVVGNPLESIASGPTAPDPTTNTDALEILKKYELQGNIPGAIVETLKNVSETPKPGDQLFEKVQNIVIGSNFLAAQSALGQAQLEGFRTIFLGDSWQGEAREVARKLCTRLKEESVGAKSLCLVAGGETTVTLHGTGRGGRNQELALAAVEELAGYDNILLISLATDGEDGPTRAAGAVVIGNTQERARFFGYDAKNSLSNNDAFPFFDVLGDLLKPGPTGTNVNDLVFLFAFNYHMSI